MGVKNKMILYKSVLIFVIRNIFFILILFVKGLVNIKLIGFGKVINELNIFKICFKMFGL